MKHQFFVRSPTGCAALVAVAVLISGCASTPPQPPAALEQARATYNAVRGDPQVNKNAVVELDRATAALRDADRAWSEERDRSEVEHLAYLARRRAEIAMEASRARSADDAIQSASTERDRIRLEARTREANLAEQRGQSAQREAEAAQREALLAQQRTEAARRDALTAQQRAEQARREAEASQQQSAEAQRNASQEADKARRLQAELAELSAKQTPRGYVVTLGDILFDVNRSELRSGARRSIDRLAAFARDNPERRFEIDGFTDSQGSAEYNMGLSERRAEAVREALVGAGVASTRIDVKPYGPAYPIANNNTPAGRQLNRRVEIVISDANGRVNAR